MPELENNNGAVEVAATSEENRTYTQAEVDALLQQETDRRVSSALKKQEAKFSQKIDEAKKVAQMSEKEKYEYELAEREKLVAEREKELALAEMKNEASKVLSEKGLSLQLVDFVVNEDAEVTTANINLLEKAFKQSVKDEVEKRLATKSPLKSLPDKSQGITKEQFAKMSYTEMAALKEQQPELYNSLIGG